MITKNLDISENEKIQIYGDDVHAKSQQHVKLSK